MPFSSQFFRCTSTVVLALLSASAAWPQGASATKQARPETANPRAKVETSMGTFEIELYPADAPRTVKNFETLAERKFFNGIRFHRVVKNFVIQTGDDNTKDTTRKELWGRGGKSIYPRKVEDPATHTTKTVYEFDDELNSETSSYKEGYKKGVVAMANRGPNTNTSQFFVMLADNSTLPKNYTIFGKVVKGMDVVEAIGNVAVEPPGPARDRPKVDVLIKRITIVRSGGSHRQATPARK